MKFFFTLVVALLTFEISYAQPNLYIWEKGRSLSFESTSKIDSLTINDGSWLFQIFKPVNSGVSDKSFQGTTGASLNANINSIDTSLEVGICYSFAHSVPTYADSRHVLGNTLQGYSFTIANINSGTTYYYRTYIKLLDNVYYGPVSSIMTMGDKTINGHKFIDLGLPSGLLWAETNIGADSPSDYGDYFAWGETETKYIYNQDTYKWGNSISKYNSTDGKVTLDVEDDAATILWGIGCRMPSPSDFDELYTNCKWTWKANYNGVSGYLVTGPNSNSIFLPASGTSYNHEIYSQGTFGYYWSNSLKTGYISSAYYFGFNSNKVSPKNSYSRYYGHTIRPVAIK